MAGLVFSLRLRRHAARLALSPEEYARLVARGQKWCPDCRCWHATEKFRRDRSRGDGRHGICRRAEDDRQYRRRHRITEGGDGWRG